MTKVLLSYYNKQDILTNSSSGGIFYYLSKYYIEKKGATVFGACMNEKGDVFHVGVSTIDKLSILMRSKYVESNVKDTFLQVRNLLEKGRFVVYSGTPCQIAGLYLLLEKWQCDKNNILLIDVICHGTPRRDAWQSYLKSKDIETIHSINFRDKTNGWENFSFEINGERESFKKNDFFAAFLSNRILSEKCFKCTFKGENRYSDITLGDAWGVQQYAKDFYNPLGTSLVVIRNNKLHVEEVINDIPHKEINYTLSLFLHNCFYFISPKKPKFYSHYPFPIQTIVNNAHKPNLINRIIAGIKYRFTNLLENHFFIKELKNEYDIGIITYSGYFNFGNRLQNFALHQLLNAKKMKTINLWSNSIGHDIRKLLFQKTRDSKIYKASVKYEKSSCMLTNDNLKRIKLIIVGSDQVWNQYDYKMLKDALLVGYQHNNICSYAASFGFEKLNNVFDKVYKENLSRFANIGVRERSGINILTSLGYKGVFNLDPTFLLDEAKWVKYIKKYSTIKIPREHYTFAYFLGDGINLGENVVNVMDKNSPYYNINHFDFINLILNAESVVTDSFHGVVFSTIFHKNIIILDNSEDRKVMFTRFKSIFELYTKYTVLDDSRYYLESKDFDYEHFNSLKTESLNYLFSLIK